jgi:hypothetical protein
MAINFSLNHNKALTLCITGYNSVHKFMQNKVFNWICNEILNIHNTIPETKCRWWAFGNIELLRSSMVEIDLSEYIVIRYECSQLNNYIRM